MSHHQTVSDQNSNKEPIKSRSRESVEELNRQLAALKIQAEEYLNGWKRAKADYDNFKKETEQRQKEMVQFATMGFVMELIPVLNNFKRALSHVPADRRQHPEIAGFELIRKQLEDILETAGLKAIVTKDQHFDPTRHEALAHEARADRPDGLILEELQPGYTMHDKVIEPAKVKIVKNEANENNKPDLNKNKK